MKKFLTIGILLLSICICSVACSYTPKHINYTGSTIVDTKKYEILFDFGNIDSVIYYEDDNAFVLHYDDPDVFDLDNLAYKSGRDKWYGEYVAVDVDDTLVTEFLNDYTKYLQNKDWDYRENLNYNYVLIEEDVTYSDGTVDIVFYIRLASGDDE